MTRTGWLPSGAGLYQRIGSACRSYPTTPSATSLAGGAVTGPLMMRWSITYHSRASRGVRSGKARRSSPASDASSAIRRCTSGSSSLGIVRSALYLYRSWCDSCWWSSGLPVSRSSPDGEHAAAAQAVGGNGEDEDRADDHVGIQRVDAVDGQSVVDLGEQQHAQRGPGYGPQTAEEAGAADEHSADRGESDWRTACFDLPASGACG